MQTGLRMLYGLASPWLFNGGGENEAGGEVASQRHLSCHRVNSNFH